MRKILILTACCLLGCWIEAQNPVVSPKPHVCTMGDGHFSKPGTFLYKGLNEMDTTNQRVVKGLIDGADNKGGYWKLIIGESNDKSIRSFRKFIPEKKEGYYLRIRKKEIVVAGYDERGTFYALQTLKQLLSRPELPELEITDSPDVPLRGVVEGYYGTPMDYETRVRMLNFYGANKLNTYIYGPKDDPYHSSPNWRKPYPEKESAQIRNLVNVARMNGVDFTWAIHPGKDIQWNDADRDAVVQKFEAMYQLGVRSYAVFFDDITGKGADTDKQVELLNYLNAQFIHKKMDVKALIMCPTVYNKEADAKNSKYLATLGEKLDKDIAILWTGNSVVSDIQQEDLDWVNDIVKRKTFVWWNFPVNDYCVNHLLLGPVYGNSRHIAEKMSGWVSNPMELAEASKIAIYSIADYCWNMQAFDSNKSWNQAISKLLPHDADALKLFAEHNSDPGDNVHHYTRKESERIRPAMDEFLQKATKATASFKDNEVRTEFENIVYAADILMASTENPYLQKELAPWFPQFKTLGEMGVEVMNMYKFWQEQYQEEFLKSYRRIRALQYIWYNYDRKINQDARQPGVKTGSKVLKPFIDKLFVYLTEAYNHRFQAELSTSMDFSKSRN